MKKLIFVVSLTTIALLIAAGCGDDDCPSCPSDTDTVYLGEEYLVWLDGYVLVDPNTILEIDGLANGGAIANIDSFAVGDSVSTDVFMSFWWHSGDPYYYFEWIEDETPPYMYESGDLATVTIWGDDRSSSATVSILDWTDDATEILVPSGDTIVNPAQDLEIAWSRVAGAEWYGVELSFTLDSGGVEYFYRNQFDYTLDTVFTVPSTLSGYDVVTCYFWVIPVTGPDPESGNGNWEGDYVAGKLFSLGGEVGAQAAFVGAGASKPIVRENEPASQPSGREILKGVIDAYK